MRRHNCRPGGPVRGHKRYRSRGSSGPSSLYGRFRPIKGQSPGTEGRRRTTDAVARAKARKASRVPTKPSSVADTVSFIKGCLNLEPDHAGAMVARAGGTREEVMAIVAWAEAHCSSSSVTVTKSTPPKPPSPPKTSGGSAVEFGQDSSADVNWQRQCEDFIADYTRRHSGGIGSGNGKLENETWHDYYCWLRNQFGDR